MTSTGKHMTIRGIHHVTGISGPAQDNLDFYVGVLGLRFVKRTVNFDDPGTYHFYFGDDLGRPGTILTFFPWSGVPKGRSGQGMTTETSFIVPKDRSSSGSSVLPILRLISMRPKPGSACACYRSAIMTAFRSRWWKAPERPTYPTARTSRCRRSTTSAASTASRSHR